MYTAVNVEATPTDLPVVEPLENNDIDTLNQKKVRFVTHDKPTAPSSTAKLSKQQAGSKRKGATNQREKGPSDPPSKELEEDEAFEVEAILAHRKVKGRGGSVVVTQEHLSPLWFYYLQGIVRTDAVGWLTRLGVHAVSSLCKF